MVAFIVVRLLLMQLQNNYMYTCMHSCIDNGYIAVQRGNAASVLGCAGLEDIIIY